jgi:4-carboxymuconolactone decarboxylase
MKPDFKIIRESINNEKAKLLTRIFERDGLSDEKRILCLISCLQAAAGHETLEIILKSSIKNEDDLLLVYEVLLQGYLFCGYPRAIESFFCLNNALKGEDYPKLQDFNYRPLDSNDTLMNRGERLASAIHLDKFRKINNKISDFCPDLGYLMIAEGYGHILSREGLEIQNRELAVVSNLTALRAYRQLNSHIRGARNVGCDDSEIYEAIYTCIAEIQERYVRSALEIWAQITNDEITDKIN